jgi:hypothetical protein
MPIELHAGLWACISPSLVRHLRDARSDRCHQKFVDPTRPVLTTCPYRGVARRWSRVTLPWLNGNQPHRLDTVSTRRRLPKTPFGSVTVPRAKLRDSEQARMPDYQSAAATTTRALAVQTASRRLRWNEDGRRLAEYQEPREQIIVSVLAKAVRRASGSVGARAP